MPKSRIQIAFFSLLQSGLWDSDIESLYVFPLTDREWEEIYQLSRRQTVTGLVFSGIQKLKEDFQPEEDLLVKWIATIDAIERYNIRMNQVLLELKSIFEEYGLHPVLLKGQGLAGLYNEPLLRECGDIDLYFVFPQEFKDAVNCIHSLGINVMDKADGSLIYFWKGIKVEHHKRLLDLFSSDSVKIADDMERKYGFKEVGLSDVYALKIQIPHPVINITLQSVHILKHALGLGIGLRQFCDLAISLKAWHNELPAKDMIQISEDLHLVKWFTLLYSFLAEYLNISSSYLPYQCSANQINQLFDIIWSGGNFGQHANNKRYTGEYSFGNKIITALTYARNIRFAYEYAPKEAFALIMNLIRGQFK